MDESQTSPVEIRVRKIGLEDTIGWPHSILVRLLRFKKKEFGLFLQLARVKFALL